MATNFVQEGNVIDWTNKTDAAVASGELVQVGFRGMGVALAAIADDATGSVMIDGVFDFPLHASDATAIGGPAYWDGTNPRNAAAAGRFFMGHFTEIRAAASGQSVGVKLAPFSAEPGRMLTAAAAAATTLAAANFLGGDLTVLAPNTEAVALNLPSVALVPVGSKLRVRKTHASTTAVTVTPSGAETITTVLIDADNDMALFQSTATGWLLIDSAI
jgi:predicted RecA/RadA family phage recombinase